MKKIYVVYECNGMRTYESMCIKSMSTNKSLAESIYSKMKKEYSKTDWFLNLAEYNPRETARSGDNILKDLTNILTTENND